MRCLGTYGKLSSSQSLRQHLLTNSRLSVPRNHRMFHICRVAGKSHYKELLWVARTASWHQQSHPKTIMFKIAVCLKASNHTHKSQSLKATALKMSSTPSNLAGMEANRKSLSKQMITSPTRHQLGVVSKIHRKSQIG